MNGEYSLAITQDGAIVADFITTGTLNGALLQAGRLKRGAFNTTGAYRFSDNQYDGWVRELNSMDVNSNNNAASAIKTVNAAGKWSKGGTSEVSILQPYITCYMWKRTG